MACSDLAGKRLFKNSKFTILENGVDIKKYKYNNDIAKELKNKLNIPAKAKVIGHVGRFDKVKNHKFIVDIFNEYIQENKNTYLLLVGSGPEMEAIKETVK